jgi:biopolymer transport protein ExbD
MSIRVHHDEGALDVVHEINVTPFIDVVLVLLSAGRPKPCRA